ncbi:hypothetical protein D3C73_462150 [compost metagenome]
MLEEAINQQITFLQCLDPLERCFDHLLAHTGDVAKLHAPRLPRQIQTLCQIGHVSQVHFHFIDSAGRIAIGVVATEPFAVSQPLRHPLTGNGAEFIEPGLAQGQFQQLRLDQVRTHQGVGFMHHHLHAHGIEQLRAAIHALGGRCRLVEQFASQFTVAGHGFEHAPDLGRQFRLIVTAGLEVGGLGELAQFIEKRHRTKLVFNVVPDFLLFLPLPLGHAHIPIRAVEYASGRIRTLRVHSDRLDVRLEDLEILRRDPTRAPADYGARQ